MHNSLNNARVQPSLLQMAKDIKRARVLKTTTLPPTKTRKHVILTPLRSVPHDTESQYGTDVHEQNPCDKTRDCWDNMEGRWVRVHGIARRTLFDPIHDEQPFCQDLTARRRTTIKFLGQQSEMTIDDTWPQTGEMRSLWKGSTEFWPRDMPQDDTWKPNRHHSDILPLFRNHLTRNAVAMSPSPVDRVVQAEHERRDSNLHAVPHTEDADKKGRSVVLKLPELSNVHSTHRDDSSCTTAPQDAAVEDTNTRRQRQNSSEGMPSSSGQALGQRHGEEKTRVSCAGTLSTTKEKSLGPARRSKGD